MQRMPRAPLTLLYRDERYVAVDKPCGLLVHRSPLDRHATDFALQRLRDQIGRRVYPVHRLDRPTSGVLLFALDSEAARIAGEAWMDGRATKTYLAVVRGHVPEADVIDYPLVEEPGCAPVPAITEYRRLATTELPIPVGRYATARYSLVGAIPRTGRLHQIRKHFHHVSHHVIGDTTHGDGRHNRMLRERLGIERLLLHAWMLELPGIGLPPRIVADARRAFGPALDALGLEAPVPGADWTDYSGVTIQR